MEIQKLQKLYSDAIKALEQNQKLSIDPDDLLVLLEHSEKYSNVLKTTSEGYWLIDPTTKKTLEVNESLCNILGYAEDEIIGRTPLEFVDETNKAIFIEQTGKIKKTDHRSYEIELRHKNGTNIPCLFHASTIKDEQQKPIFAVAFVSDVSQIKAFEKELVSARKIAEEANLVKSQFLANMSHDLRTPMHAILSFTSLALKKINDEKKLKQFLGNIRESGLRLTSLLNDLLDLSKLESGKMHLEFAVQNITRLFEQSLTEVGSLLAEKHIEVILDKDMHYECMVDKSAMLRVFVNLLSNAIKFSPANSSIRIEIEKLNVYFNHDLQNIIRIGVFDEGVGIPDVEIEHVFGKYVQSSATKSKVSGTGLGLSISKEIIKHHNGHIWVESPPQGRKAGSVFYIEIPILQGLPNQVSVSNIQDAVNSHLEWVKVIEETFVSRTVSIDIPNSVISNENLCSLGQWINTKKIQTENLQQLKAIHKEFHMLAGECMAYCEIADYEKAEEKLNDFKAASIKIIDLLKSISFIIWSDNYSVGVETLDNQHKRLVEIVNALIDQSFSVSSYDEIDDVFDNLIKYAHEHLEYEEKLLAENNYQDFDNHKQMHIAYLEKFNEFCRKVNPDRPEVLREMTEFLKHWWQHHILVEDMKYKAFFEEKGIS